MVQSYWRSRSSRTARRTMWRRSSSSAASQSSWLNSLGTRAVSGVRLSIGRFLYSFTRTRFTGSKFRLLIQPPGNLFGKTRLVFRRSVYNKRILIKACAVVMVHCVPLDAASAPHARALALNFSRSVELLPVLLQAAAGFTRVEADSRVPKHTGGAGGARTRQSHPLKRARRKKVERRPSGRGSTGTASGSGSNSRALPSPLALDPEACSPAAVTGPDRRARAHSAACRNPPWRIAAADGLPRLARAFRVGFYHSSAAGQCIVEPHYSRKWTGVQWSFWPPTTKWRLPGAEIERRKTCRIKDMSSIVLGIVCYRCMT